MANKFLKNFGEYERIFWHYVIAICFACGVLGAIISLVRWGALIAPCCN